MSPRPRISVIIPAFQEEKLIARTLDQFTPALKERHNLEIVVSDGGSTDRTVAISAPRAQKVIKHAGAARQNISQGRNCGARAAEGEIFFFINADTLLRDADRFLDAMESVAGDDTVAAATCSVFVYPEEETAADRLFHLVYNWYFSFLNTAGMGMGRGECHVMRREMYERIGGYNESIAAGEDYEMFLRLRRVGKIKFLSSAVVYESPRRYRKYGYLRISVLWFLNAVSVLLFRRSMTKHWEAVR